MDENGRNDFYSVAIFFESQLNLVVVIPWQPTNDVHMNIISGFYSETQVADIFGVSKETVRRWDESGRLVARREEASGLRFYSKDQLLQFEEGPRKLFSVKVADDFF